MDFLAGNEISARKIKLISLAKSLLTSLEIGTRQKDIAHL